MFSLSRAKLALSIVFFTMLPPALTQASSSISSQNRAKQTNEIIRQEHQLQLKLLRIQAEIQGLKKNHKERQLAVVTRKKNTRATNDSPNQKVRTKKTTDKISSTQTQPLTNELFSEDPLIGISRDVNLKIHQAAINYLNGVTVITSPILGLRSAWTATDLLYQVPSMNEDLRLLRDRAGFEHVLNSMGGSLNNRPLIVFSGALEGSAVYTEDYVNNSSVQMNLSTADIDVWPIISAWANGFFSINFDSSPPQTGSRVTNSRLYLARGFLTIGNLDATPFYLTLGQMYVPFGRYASALITTPLTLSLGRVAARAALLGYYEHGFYAEAYTFNGNRKSEGDRLILQSGFNVGFERANTTNAVDLGAGYITNLADSQGMIRNGLDPTAPALAAPSTQFAGFGFTFNLNSNGTNIVEAENLRHNAHALDFHMELTLHKWVLLSEVLTTVRRFAPGDLLFAGHGALPGAMHIELDYNTKNGKIPYTFGVAYGQTWQALPLNLPQYSLFLVFNTSPWKDTQLALEYRHDINYQVTPNTGGGGNGNLLNIHPVPDTNIGGSQDLVTFLLGVYF